MIMFLVEFYVISALLNALFITFCLQEMREPTLVVMNIDENNRLYETFRIMLCGPLISLGLMR